MRNNYIYLLALFPILSIQMVSVFIILFFTGSLFSFIQNRKKPTSIRIVIVFTIPFFMYLTSLIWTSNTSLGINYVTRTLSFIIFPIILFLFKPFKSLVEVKKFNRIFICATAVSILITFLYIIINIDNIFIDKNSYYTIIKLRQSIALVPFIGEHPIYFSLIIAISLILLIYNRFENKYINIILFILFLTGIIIASSKGVILTSFTVLILLAYLENKNKKKAFLIILFLFFGLFIISFSPPIKERINEIVNTKNYYPEGVNFNSHNLRIAIYDCSFSLLKETPLLGFSPGDIQQQLNTCYKKFNTNAFKETEYNTHNQYFHYYLSFGPIGFFIILISFFFFLRIAIVNKNNQYVAFLILIYLNCLTENILVRNTGIVLFTMFNCLFAYSIFLKNKKLY